MSITLKKGAATEHSYGIRCHVCGQVDWVFKDSCFRCRCRFHEDVCGTSITDRPGNTSYYCHPCYIIMGPQLAAVWSCREWSPQYGPNIGRRSLLSADQHGLSYTAAATEHPMTHISSAHIHATEQDPSIPHNQRQQDLTATTEEKEYESFSTMIGIVGNTPSTYEYNLLLYWACSRPVARVHMATIPQRRQCKSLRAAWTLHCMTQLCRYELSGCRGCGHYPISSICSNCSTAWCRSCHVWSSLCWKCYRPRYSLTDTGEFMTGFGGPAGNGSFETAL